MNNTTTQVAALTVQHDNALNLDRVQGISGIYTIERITTGRDNDFVYGEGRAFLVYFRPNRRRATQQIKRGVNIGIVVRNSIVSLHSLTKASEFKNADLVTFGYFTFDEALDAVRNHNNVCISAKQQAEARKARKVENAKRLMLESVAAQVNAAEARRQQNAAPEYMQKIVANMDAQQAERKTRNSRFAKGSGCYTCQSCGKQTRSTGRGDNENVGLCASCFDEAGDENFHSDNHGRDYATCPLCHPAKAAEIIEAAHAEALAINAELDAKELAETPKQKDRLICGDGLDEPMPAPAAPAVTLVAVRTSDGCTVTQDFPAPPPAQAPTVVLKRAAEDVHAMYNRMLDAERERRTADASRLREAWAKMRADYDALENNLTTSVEAAYQVSNPVVKAFEDERGAITYPVAFRTPGGDILSASRYIDYLVECSKRWLDTPGDKTANQMQAYYVRDMAIRLAKGLNDIARVEAIAALKF